MVKKLYRSRYEGQLGGICAGLGRYFELDPVLIRLIVVVVTVFTGILPGVLTYAAAWFIMPEEPLPLPASPPEPVQPAP